MKLFEQYQFQPFVKETIQELNFKSPTNIQKSVIPLVYKYIDVIGISQTGTGKTHAFLIPIMDMIDVEKDCVQAVITAPTRELASQIYEHAKLFVKHNPDLKVSLIIGGSDKQKAINKLSTQPHIVIGTPGRIKDLSLDEQALRITTADIFVVDEADMTLEFGYLEDIDAVLSKMKDNLQMMVFSATIPQMLRPFLQKYMKAPKIIEIDEHLSTSRNISHYLVPTKHRQRYEVLKEVMSIIDPYICLIFCNKRNEVEDIAHRLREDGYKVGEIHGNLEPRERRQMMRRIKNMEYQYIVATDIAARGIDIDGASHIINMEFPTELDFYIHRSGRCGRGKYTGECYSMYDTSNQSIVEALEKKGIHFEVKELKGNQFVESKEREKRKSRQKHQTELEQKISSIVRKPTKVKPGYKKKRKRVIEKMVKQEKRAIIRQDIKRQKKERAKQAQREKRERESQ
ncbi:DEAD/DEAH box helicase [Longibaculum muris]|uniref:ATP-dependent RNA helicase CshB n=1 Tax=Longibaculum muris TaxID=1796628 RepID=A0A4R3YIF9_9FIRM|nr:DEAD/DEAH box helicase [Longibaculum muris]KXU50316.1 putative DEAD-box ATP-dependent RNA helicase CshB [Candidatus Stoquefichus sp. KLE1796]MBS5370564.1 DEAD/DEAH box helicase [Coprobacillus cateniformis]MCR1887105.1 DEAD/DEAH box helicase [Longibaculum muris]TCV91996.1 ATP-dependent RNA helicase CshB [Longibaculum muris]